MAARKKASSGGSRRRREPAAREVPSYASRANQYARDVVAGKILACKWVRKAAQRHLDDLVRSRTKEFAYKFDTELAGRACRFIEALPHRKGEWARKRPGG